jgi:hypothetical protein
VRAAIRAGRGQTANFRQTAPEIHVSPRNAGNSCQAPDPPERRCQSPGCPKMNRGKLAAKVLTLCGAKSSEMPGARWRLLSRRLSKRRRTNGPRRTGVSRAALRISRVGLDRAARCRVAAAGQAGHRSRASTGKSIGQGFAGAALLLFALSKTRFREILGAVRHFPAGSVARSRAASDLSESSGVARCG